MRMMIGVGSLVGSAVLVTDGVERMTAGTPTATTLSWLAMMGHRAAQFNAGVGAFELVAATLLFLATLTGWRGLLARPAPVSADH